MHLCAVCVCVLDYLRACLLSTLNQNKEKLANVSARYTYFQLIAKCFVRAIYKKTNSETPIRIEIGLRHKNTSQK